MIGTTLGRYMILSEIGRGGMSTVYLAEDTSLERQVAVKVLHPHLANRKESCARFAREARAIARLRHPNIVEIFDCSTEEADTRYIVTEFVDGPNLRDFIEAHDVSCPELGVALGFELCAALEHAHALGIIHRDIKPENVLIQTLEGRLKLTDFGIAQILDADTLTATGSLLGSPAHMPPEMIDGLPGDRRGDIFSLGTVLYFLITNGLLPFEGKTPSAVLRNILEVRFRDPEVYNPRVGRQLSRIVKRCLARQPEDRFQTVTDVRAALREELATLGFDDPTAIVRQFLQQPDTYPDTFERQVVVRLLDMARAALRRRQVGQAVDHINRILAYQPDHADALGLLQKIQRRHRLLQSAGAIAAALLLAVAAYSLYPLWPTPDSQAASSLTAAASPNLPEETNPPDPTPLARASLVGALHGLAVGWSYVPPAPVLAANPSAPAVPMLALIKAKLPKLEELALPESLETNLRHSLRRPLVHTVDWVAAEFTPRAALTARVNPPAAKPDRNPPPELTPEPSPLIPTPPTPTPIPGPKLTPVTFLIFPRETSFAHFGGRSYASADGQIKIAMPPGPQKVSFGCPTCDVVEKTVSIPDTGGKPYKEVVKPQWKKALVTVDFSKFGDQEIYALLQEGKQRPRVYQPDNKKQLVVPIDFSGAGTPETLTVYVYLNQPRSVSANDLMEGAIDKTTTEVGPGDNPTISFR